MSYASEVLADSPVGYWRLNETSGSTLIDSSGNGLDGTYINSPTLNQASPVSGGASVLFNGTTQYASIAHDVLLDITDVTMEIWVNFVTQTTGANETIFGRPVSTVPTNVPYRIYDDTSENDGIRGGFYEIAIPKTARCSARWTNEWRLLAFTVEDSGGSRTVRAYQNGVQQDTLVTSDTVPTRTSSLFIGAENNRRFVNAYLAEAALYSTALSSTRLLAHYTAATTPNTRRRRYAGGYGL